jgi:hypothetical protein
MGIKTLFSRELFQPLPFEAAYPFISFTAIMAVQFFWGLTIYPEKTTPFGAASTANSGIVLFDFQWGNFPGNC